MIPLQEKDTETVKADKIMQEIEKILRAKKLCADQENLKK